MTKEHSSWWLVNPSPILTCHLMHQKVMVTTKSLWLHFAHNLSCEWAKRWKVIIEWTTCLKFVKYPSRFSSHHNWRGCWGPKWSFRKKINKPSLLTTQKDLLGPSRWFTCHFDVNTGGPSLPSYHSCSMLLERWDSNITTITMSIT